jgi:hypothetical protein
MPKPNALKIKSKSNIQTIQLYILNKFYQEESFEIFKQAKFEHEQLIKKNCFNFALLQKVGW